ncbi:atp-binding cassette superfamily, partial [Plasmopara halstedii]
MVFSKQVESPITTEFFIDEPTRAKIEYQNGKALMARGPQALHEHVVFHMEKALGRALPQMEVRFKDVSISADITVKDEMNLML